MADQKVSDLPSLNGADVDAADLLYIIDSSAGAAGSKKITVGQYQLAPVSGGTANGVVYLDNTKVATSGSGLVFDTSGNLGIGTSSPGARLETVAAGTALYFSGGDSSVARRLQFNATTTTNTGDTQNINALGSTGVLAFSTNSTERMRLDSSGNLGIKTNSPGATLDVAGNARSNAWIGRANGSAPTADAAVYRPADNSLGFSTANTERARIDSSGNLGIGTSSPVGKVDAVANAYAAFVARASTSGAGQTVDALKAIDSAASNFANAKYTANEHIWNYAGASEGMRLDASGNFAVGSTPSSSVKVFGLSGNNQHGVYGQTQGSGTAYYGVYGISTKSVSSGGVIGISTNGTTYGILGYNDGTNQWAGYFVGSTYATGTYQGSDARLKENVQPLSGSLQKLAALRPVKFDWKQNSDPERNGIKHDVGLIAQEVLPVLPDVVKEVSGTNPLPDSDPSLNSQLGSFYTIEYTKLIPHLISAIQEQQAIIEDLRARVAALESK